MTNLRILYLDSEGGLYGSWLDTELQMEGFEPEILSEVVIQPYANSFQPSPDFLRKLKEYTLSKPRPDIIIIRNNQGAGLLKARYIPLTLRSITLVTWMHDPTPEDQAPYQALGYTQFVHLHRVAPVIIMLCLSKAIEPSTES